MIRLTFMLLQGNQKQRHSMKQKQHTSKPKRQAQYRMSRRRAERQRPIQFNAKFQVMLLLEKVQFREQCLAWAASFQCH